MASNQYGRYIMKGVGCIVFIKYPIERTVKTRLLLHLKPSQATELHRCFVLDTIQNFSEYNIPLTLAYTPKERFASFKDWLGEKFCWIPQEEGHLGQRIAKAIQEVFLNDSVKHCLIFGTDSPDFPPGIVNKATLKLGQYDVVLGPAMDGGYYCIGVSKKSFDERLFETIPWGTPQVLKETLSRCQQLRLTTHLLPEWWDVDTYADLQLFRKRNLSSKRVPHSIQYLLKNNIG